MRITMCIFGLLFSGIATHARSVDSIIVPGKSFGKYSWANSEADLKRIFGTENVIANSFQIEGEKILCSTVFPKDPSKKLDFTWTDLKKKSGLNFLVITGDAWEVSNVARIGTSLAELERKNGRPFTLSGFGWDYGGTVLSWKAGKLDKLLDPTLKFEVIVRLSSDLQESKEYRKVSGDSEFNSSSKEMQKLNPQVYELMIRPKS